MYLLKMKGERQKVEMGGGERNKFCAHASIEEFGANSVWCVAPAFGFAVFGIATRHPPNERHLQRRRAPTRAPHGGGG